MGDKIGGHDPGSQRVSCDCVYSTSSQLGGLIVDELFPRVAHLLSFLPHIDFGSDCIPMPRFIGQLLSNPGQSISLAVIHRAPHANERPLSGVQIII